MGGLTSAYRHGVQNVYRDGSTAMLRLSNGLFVSRLVDDWTGEKTEPAPRSVTSGIAGLMRLPTEAHGTAFLGDLVTWSDDASGATAWSMRPGAVLDVVFNKTLIREGLRAFESRGLKPDVSLVVRLVQSHTGPCLIVSHGVDAIFVMALTHGETPGSAAPVKVVRR